MRWQNGGPSPPSLALSRAERLLDLLQLLRRHRHPVAGASMAAELGVSLRTLYRDIATLQSQGAMIEGEPGMGYVLRPGFTLPPMMFSEDEIEAMVLGSRWVAARADSRLGKAALNALAKIAAVLPPDLRDDLDATALLVGPGEPLDCGDEGLDIVRRAIRGQHKLQFSYLDLKNGSSQRTVWPFAIGFFDRARVVVAWCELRQANRHFRLDRMSDLSLLEGRYPRGRQALLKAWRRAEGIPEA